MSAANGRFFIALLPSQAIQDDANAVKQVFVERYNSSAALKSPPHITLQPPFEWSLAAFPVLTQRLSEFAAQSAPLSIALSGFGAFPPHVIYINVTKTQPLLALQIALIAHLEQSLGIVDETAKMRSFIPHMTVAFHDLTQENFQLAWAEFQHRSLERAFTATHLTLLRHVSQQWLIDAEFPFLAS